MKEPKAPFTPNEATAAPQEKKKGKKEKERDTSDIIFCWEAGKIQSLIGLW